jgi:glycosyltransferase involved in cell wall biosynthesis
VSEAAPTFSVVIAAYQVANFIGDAIGSALEQDPAPHEIVVGNDGSTDDLAGALRPFGDAVRLVTIEHAGEAAAKNAAVAAATGEFVAFLDADDRFLPGRLAALQSLLSARPELDVVTTDAYLVHNGERLGRCYGPGYRFAPVDQRRAILERNFVLGLSVVRRSRFLAAGGFDPAVAYTTDWDLWIRMILDGSTVGFVDEPLAEYRLHAGSMSARRAEMSRGRLMSIARAEARSDLTQEERLVLRRSRRVEEARLRREELKEHLRTASYRQARRAAIGLAVAPRQALATRLKAVVAAVAPAEAARRLRVEEAGSFVSVGDRRLPR